MCISVKPKVWTYENPSKQTVHFRGYVLEYTDSPTVYRHACKEVRRNKWQAKADAENLIKTLKKQKACTTYSS